MNGYIVPPIKIVIINKNFAKIKRIDDNNEVTSTTADMPSKWQYLLHIRQTESMILFYW